MHDNDNPLKHAVVEFVDIRGGYYDHERRCLIFDGTTNIGPDDDDPDDR